MPALNPIPPIVLRDILVKFAFNVVDESPENWLLAREDLAAPLSIPKNVDLVALEIMDHALDLAKMNNENYFKLLQQVRDGGKA